MRLHQQATPLSYPKNNLTYFLFGLSLFFLQLALAQERQDYVYDGTDLETVIKDVEVRNDVVFSYALDVVSGKVVSLDAQQVTLEDILSLLQAQTILSFQLVSPKQVIVSPIIPERNSVCGYLIDAATKAPIPFATIIISGNLQTTTNEDGFFTFQRTASNSYVAQTIGYAAKEFQGARECVTISMTSTTESLTEVVISGYVTSGIDWQRDGSVSVDQKKLGILPGLVTPDLLQSIQLIPGIGSLDESASGIQIRGGTPDQNLILFDDIKVYNTGYLYGAFSAFNPFATKKATIFKSGTEAAYGDRISGIIDISTGDNIPEKIEAGVGIDGLSADAYVRAPLSDKWAVNVFARKSYSEVYKSPTYDSYAEKLFRNVGEVRDINGNIITVETDDEYTVDTSTNEFSFYDANVKAIYQPDENNKIVLSSLYTRNDLDFEFTNTGETRIDSLVTKNYGVSLRWDHRSTENRTEEITAYIANYDSHYLNEEFVENTLEETNIRSNQIFDYGLTAISRRDFNEKHSLSFGYQFSNSRVNIDLVKEEPSEPEDNQFVFDEQSNLKNALFGTYTYRFSNKGILSAGVRSVHYGSVGELYIEPRLNVVFPMTNAIRLKASLERRNQPISQLVEFNQTELRLENNIWRLSDDRTYPLLQSNQASLGVILNSNGWTVDFDAYLKRLSGLTSFTSGFSTPQLQLSEGESEIVGFDILFKKRVGAYRVWAGYSLNDIDFTFDAIQPESFDGNNDITHSFRISNSLSFKNLQISVGWQYRTGEPFTPISNFNPENSDVRFGAINSDRLEDYHRLDASIIYNFTINKKKGWKAQLGFSALNLYDRKIPLSITYRAEEEDDVDLELKQVIQRFSLGFTSNASLRIFF
ncbi:TonB-dependent receptor [Aureisphaera galaxeae]|uniref:TonB-dependent receptor n=1 Tax=Aureisphaera galaxeae TaxID=1538023 RepID=UPI00234FBB09|nr:TonB-dependent receptor [Aureisphaera galaxeae]MDC8004568.1 TonB-dependent receptor [Aureisphaera galaxeae]